MAKTEKELEEIEAELKEEAKKLEAAQKEFEEHVHKEETRLRSSGKSVSGSAPKSVFKSGPTEKEKAKRVKAAEKAAAKA